MRRLSRLVPRTNRQHIQRVRRTLLAVVRSSPHSAGSLDPSPDAHHVAGSQSGSPSSARFGIASSGGRHPDS